MDHVLRAVGSAIIDHGGQTYLVGQPEIVPIEAAAGHLAAKDRRSTRWFGDPLEVPGWRAQFTRMG